MLINQEGNELMGVFRVAFNETLDPVERTATVSLFFLFVFWLTVPCEVMADVQFWRSQSRVLLFSQLGLIMLHFIIFTAGFNAF